jgi:hypothetical protein
MKKLLLTLALLFAPSLAWGQCNGSFPSNTVCGTVAGGIPGPITPGSFSSSIILGSTAVVGGVSTRVLYDNAGFAGEYTNTQLTALINAATTSLSGALPAWPNNTTTFFRGDGTYAGITCGALPPLTGDITSSACATTLATVNTNTGSWGTATQAPQFTVNGKGLITAAANVTITPPFTALTGQATFAQLPSMTANSIMSNVTSGSATPLDNSLSSVLDILGSARGNVIYRGAGGWVALAPGTSGQLLQSGGAGADPSWLTASGTGTVTSVANDNTIKSSVGSNGAITTSGTLGLWGGQGDITNCILTGTVSGNALTVALKAQDGNTPSATDPCIIAFRNATIATGDYTYLQVTAATTFATATSGSTFGSTSSTPFRLWITAWNNAGTVVLGVSNQSKSTQISPLNEGNVQSSTACNACGTATAVGTFYTTAAQTSKAIRIMGYMDWAAGLGTAGTWASGPTTIQLFGPGIKKPGDVVQSVYGTASSATSSNNSSAVVGNPAVSITPTSATNLIKLTLSGSMQGPGTGTGQLRIGRASGGSGSCVSMLTPNTITTNITSGASIALLDAPSTSSQTTYAPCVSSNGSATTTWCPLNNIQAVCTLEVDEIQG